MIFLPILRKAFQSAGDVPCLHSVSLRWEQSIKSQFMTCNVKNSLYFLFSFLFFLPFCCFFSCCNFCFGSACHGRGRGENYSGGPEGVVVVVVFWFCCDLWFCGGQECVVPLSAVSRIVCLWQSCLNTLLWIVRMPRMFFTRMFKQDSKFLGFLHARIIILNMIVQLDFAIMIFIWIHTSNNLLRGNSMKNISARNGGIIFFRLLTY